MQSSRGVWFQVGITSFGWDTKEGYIFQDVYPGTVFDTWKIPGVYTRVASYCDFVDLATNGEVQCGTEKEEGGNGDEEEEPDSGGRCLLAFTFVITSLTMI